MDPKLLQEEAMAATARFFSGQGGAAPDPDSEEWEQEYRRQFALVKRLHALDAKGPPQPPRAAEAAAPADAAQDDGPPLSGHDAERRWALALRAERIKEIRNPELRRWLAQAWTASREWIDTRDLEPAVFLHKIEAQFSAYRRRSEAQARTQQAERDRAAEAAAAIERQVREAGISAEGLVELIDVSPRAQPTRAQAKIADLTVGDRSLRVFETADLAVLVVIEKGPDGRREYAIERDAGLAADLGLFARQAGLRHE